MESQQDTQSLDWRPVTVETLLSLPPFVAGMVRDLTEGEREPVWVVRTLEFDWNCLDELPIDVDEEEGVWEIATEGWLRCGSNLRFSISPRPLGRAFPAGRPIAWLLHRLKANPRRVTVWRVAWTPAGDEETHGALPQPASTSEVEVRRAGVRDMLARFVVDGVLPLEENEVLLARLGLVGGVWYSLDDTGIYTGISRREKVRAAQSRALRRIGGRQEFAEALRAYLEVSAPPRRLRHVLTAIVTGSGPDVKREGGLAS
jgi:hypothetical protein